ncbi:MAG: hypothetical protein NVSMB6_01500 [Burkholderiaceae bacterium]
MFHSLITTRRGGAMLALATVSVLTAGCGGFTSVDVGGTIEGLTAPGLILANGDDKVSPAPGAKTFVFPTQVSIRAPYSVAIAQQPSRQTCRIFNNAGVAGAAPVTIVALVCSTNTYSVGGTINGLTGANLILTNGSDQVMVSAAAASGSPVSFTFPTPVADQLPYGAAILKQPDNAQNCMVASGTGTALVNAANVTSIQVNCR